MKFNTGDIIVSKKQKDIKYVVVEDKEHWLSVRASLAGGKMPTWLDKNMFRLEAEEPKTFKVGDVVSYDDNFFPAANYAIVEAGAIYSKIQRGTIQPVMAKNTDLTLTSSVEDRIKEVSKTKAVETSPQLEFEWT